LSGLSDALWSASRRTPETLDPDRRSLADFNPYPSQTEEADQHTTNSRAIRAKTACPFRGRACHVQRTLDWRQYLRHSRLL